MSFNFTGEEMTEVDKALMLRQWVEMREYVQGCPRAAAHFIAACNDGIYHGMQGSIDIRKMRLAGTGEPRWVILRWLENPEFPEAGLTPLPMVVCRTEAGGYAEFGQYWVDEFHRGYFEDPKAAIVCMLEQSRKRIAEKEARDNEEELDKAHEFAFDMGVRTPTIAVPRGADAGADG